MCLFEVGIIGGGDIRASMKRAPFGKLGPVFKGGDGSDADDLERERRRIAEEARNAILQQFELANREQAYDEHRQAVYDLNTQEVNRQAEEAERANRFAMARNGLLGGSVNIDANEELNRRTNEGLMQAQGLADNAAASLRSQDESTKNSLLSMASNGINSAQATELATSGLKTNLANAAANEAVAQVGNLFGDMQNAYLYNTAVKNTLGSSYNPYAQQQKNPTAPQNSYGGTVS